MSIWSAWGRRLVALPGVTAFTAFIGLGTAAFKNTGTSGDAVPLLDGANTWSGVQIISVAAAGTVLSVRSVDDGAGSGPDIAVRRISSTPLANDNLGTFAFQGNDSLGNNTNYAQLGCILVDPTDGAETGSFVFNSRINNVFATRLSVTGAGMVSVGTANFGRGNPVTKTADFTVGLAENWLINNKSGSACTVTLPTASSFPGREIMIKNIQAQAVNSASSNVVPLAGGAAGTVILTNTAGRWVTLVSDGTNWIAMAGVI